MSDSALLAEQESEVEALQAIYQSDFVAEGNSGTVPVRTFSLRLEPEIGGDAKTNHVCISLSVRYPPRYPESPPELDLRVEKGLDSSQMAELRVVMDACAEENAGTPLVYAVAERLREWLQEHNEPAGEGSAYEEMLRGQRAKEREASGVGKGAPDVAVAMLCSSNSVPERGSAAQTAALELRCVQLLFTCVPVSCDVVGAVTVSAYSRDADPSIKNKLAAPESRLEEEARRLGSRKAPLFVSVCLRENARFTPAAFSNRPFQFRRREGTPVTAEAFAIWRAGFEAELEAKRRADEDRYERRIMHVFAVCQCLQGAPMINDAAATPVP